MEQYSNDIAKGILKAVGFLCLVFAILFLSYKIQLIFIYLIIALILTLIGNPLVGFLKKKLKFKNIFAVITTILFFILILTGFFLMFVPLLISQGESLALLDTNAIERNMVSLIAQTNFFLSNHDIDVSVLLKEINLVEKLNFDLIPFFLNSFIGTLSGLIMGFASIMFITFFFLKDKIALMIAFKRVVPEAHEEKMMNSLASINILLTRYFIGLIIQLTIVFILYLIILVIFGVKNSVIISFLCALLNIIPYIGPLMGMILAALLTMISKLGLDFQSEILPTTIYVIIGFMIVQAIDNNINQPMIFSNSVKSHPLEIFLVILAAGFISGVTGMIVAIPVYTILKVTAKEFFPNNKIVQLLTRKF